MLWILLIFAWNLVYKDNKESQNLTKIAQHEGKVQMQNCSNMKQMESGMVSKSSSFSLLYLSHCQKSPILHHCCQVILSPKQAGTCRGTLPYSYHSSVLLNDGNLKGRRNAFWKSSCSAKICNNSPIRPPQPWFAGSRHHDDPEDLWSGGGLAPSRQLLRHGSPLDSTPHAWRRVHGGRILQNQDWKSVDVAASKNDKPKKGHGGVC